MDHHHQPRAGAAQDGEAAPAPRSQGDVEYARVARALRFVIDNFESQPRLEDIAAAAALSPFHFQRMFSRWAGVSPRQFLGYLTLEHAKAALGRGAGVLAAASEAGLSAPSRLHDLFVTFDAVTPGEHKAGGGGLDVSWGAHGGPLGTFVVAATDRGVCGLEFVGDGGAEAALAAVAARLPGARMRRRQRETGELCAGLFGDAGARAPLRLWCRGTNFRIRVWTALLSLPPGALATYGGIARAIGAPSAARAVGNAVAANPVAVLIPCHRVIRETGLFEAGYRWGAERKLALIGRELAAAAGAQPAPSTSSIV